MTQKQIQSQSNILTKFYQAMQEWIESGCPDENKYGFYERFGLCSNLMEYLELLYPDLDTGIKPAAYAELKTQFAEAGLSRVYIHSTGQAFTSSKKSVITNSIITLQD